MAGLPASAPAWMPRQHRSCLVQTVLCLLVALASLITRHLLVVLGAAALMAGTIVGFVPARTMGIFGFHPTFSSTEAWTVLIDAPMPCQGLLSLGIR